MPARRQLEVGGRGDDRRVVAAELEDQAAEAGRHDRRDGAAHPRRAGRRHDRHAVVGGERGADVGAALHDLVEPGRRADVGGGPGQQRVARQRRQRRLVRRLPDHRVAGDERQRGVPRPHGDREVERRDDGARAHRVPLLHQAVAGSLAGDRQAVQLARQPDGEVADVDHLLDLAEALGADLAGLDRHQRAEVVLVLAEQLAEAAHEVAADRRRRRAPRGEGVVAPRRRRASTSPAAPAGAERAAGDRRAGARGRRRAPAAPHAARIDAARAASASSRWAALMPRAAERGEGVGEDRQGDVGLLDRDDERRGHADRPHAARQHEQAALEARPLEGVGRVVVGQVDADHQAAAADLADQRLRRLQRREAVEQVGADGGRVGGQAVLDEVERGVRRGARDGVAAERRAVAAGRPVHDLARGRRCRRAAGRWRGPCRCT